MINRHDAIRARLDNAQVAGKIAGWTAGGGDGKRWIVWWPSGERVFTTSQVECFLVGVER